MKNPMSTLGLLLLTILLAIVAGTLLYLSAREMDSFLGLGLSIVLLLVGMTFGGYLLFDLYRSMQAREERDRRSSK